MTVPSSLVILFALVGVLATGTLLAEVFQYFLFARPSWEREKLLWKSTESLKASKAATVDLFEQREALLEKRINELLKTNEENMSMFQMVLDKLSKTEKD